MRTQKNSDTCPRPGRARKEAAPKLSDHTRKELIDGWRREALPIIRMFNDPQEFITTQHFRNMLFRMLHDALFSDNNGVVNSECIVTAYYFWKILDEVDRLNEELIPLPDDIDLNV